jgi:hypothetical protein
LEFIEDLKCCSVRPVDLLVAGEVGDVSPENIYQARESQVANLQRNPKTRLSGANFCPGKQFDRQFRPLRVLLPRDGFLPQTP